MQLIFFSNCSENFGSDDLPEAYSTNFFVYRVKFKGTNYKEPAIEYELSGVYISGTITECSDLYKYLKA